MQKPAKYRTLPSGWRSNLSDPGSDGNFYGTAERVGRGPNVPAGGLVFSLTPSGTFAKVHEFAPGENQTYPNGSSPSRLIEGPDGKLYGETYLGGSIGYGVLFRVDKTGKNYQVPQNYSVDPAAANGSSPTSLAAGNDGNVYGTTYYGGTNSCGFGNNCGTIFRVVAATGAYEVVANFDSATSGGFPTNLVVGPDGTFYGTTIVANGSILFHYIESTGELQTTSLVFPVVNQVATHGTVSAIGPDGNLYGTYSGYLLNGIGLFQVRLDGSDLQIYPVYTTDSNVSPDGLVLAK